MVNPSELNLNYTKQIMIRHSNNYYSKSIQKMSVHNWLTQKK